MNESYKGILINLVSSIIFLVASLGIGLLFDAFNFWLIAFVALLLVVVFFVLKRKKIRMRQVVVKILREVSSSKCNDYYIEYALATMDDKKIDFDSLKAILEYRKHPNLSTYKDLKGLSENGFAAVNLEKCLKTLPPRKKLLRHNVTINVAQFLREIDEKAILVLYGFSSTVCDSIADIGNIINNPILLIEDLQYGSDASLGEHKVAEKYLKEKGLTPYVLSFENIPALLNTESNFVKSINGELISLSKDRKLYTLIGCEAYDVRGNTYIPSYSAGKTSETAKFIEVFKGKSSIPSNIVIVSEAYKLYTSLSEEDLSTHAPFRISLLEQVMFTLFGRDISIRNSVKLFEITHQDIHRVIDDNAIHSPKEGAFDLSLSLSNWRRQISMGALSANKEMTLSTLVGVCDFAFFDFDGVIANTEQFHFLAFVHLCHSQGKTLSHLEYQKHCFGISDKAGITNLKEAAKLSGNVSKLLSQKESIFENLIKDANSNVLISDTSTKILKIFHDLDKKLILVTASSKSDVDRVDKNGIIKDFFKPENTFFNLDLESRVQKITSILEEAGQSQNGVVIDDSPSNIDSVMTKDVLTIGIGTSHGKSKFNSHFYYEDPQQFLEDLNRISS